MIVPYTHEDLEARRWPIVTLTLIAVNVVCLIALNIAMSGREQEINTLADRVAVYRDTHPHERHRCATVEPIPPRVRFTPNAGARRMVPGTLALGDAFVVPPEDWTAEEAEYDAMCGALDAAIADLPTHRYGYVPRENNVLGLISYQFLHGGWLHLLSNMWFLWLCGCNLEDRWGRAVFVPFYLSAGVAAALAEKILQPSSAMALVGASGAIAGAMGAFMVSFARTRIRFAYFFWVIKFFYGTFNAPAYFILPLWLVTEVLWGVIGGDGVAHWAHVGGFVYGAAFALALKKTGFERKLDDSVDALVTRVQDPRIMRAGDLINAGAPNEALAILIPFASTQPRSIDAQLEILRAAKAAKNGARERDAYARLIELYFDVSSPDTAAELFEEMTALGMSVDLTRAWALRVADHLASRSLYARADAAYRTACREGLVDVTAVRATLAHAQVALRLGQADQARTLFTAARESPFSSAEIDAVIDAEMARLAPRA